MRGFMTAICAAALVVSGGCGADSDSGACAPFDGTYRVTFEESSGTCGDFEFIERYDSSRTAEEEEAASSIKCEGERDLTDDGCHVDIERKCETYDDVTGELIGFSRLVGSVSHSRDGASAEGDVDLRILDEFGDPVCSSVGHITYRRQ